MAAPRSSSVMFRPVRRCRIRRPSTSVSRPPLAVVVMPSTLARRLCFCPGEGTPIFCGPEPERTAEPRGKSRSGRRAEKNGPMTEDTMSTTRHGDQTQTATELAASWDLDPRWAGIRRSHTAEDVVALRGSVREESTLARRGAERLWELLHSRTLLPALGALTGNQAVQQVRAGLEAIYLSGWQVAADANLSGQTYPDQSLYPANSVPAVVRRINNALLRADQIDHSTGKTGTDYLVPIVADAEAGFGGPLNAFELMKSMIDSGAAGVHWEDQLASEKKCGHMGGKVLVPTTQHVRTLNAARLAADISKVPTLVIARTDALAADLITSDIDPI